MTTNSDKATRASHELEAMLPHLRELVSEIREGKVDAYTELYDARTRLGRIVSRCGVGLPVAWDRAHDWSEYDETLAERTTL